MQLHYIILLFFLSNSYAAFSQSTGQLHLDGNLLKGKCEHRYLTGFEIELDSVYAEIDSNILFSQLPRIGTINFKNKTNIPTLFTITNRAGYSQIMFRFRTNYLTFDDLKIQKQTVLFTVDSDPVVPVTESDLSIIRLAKSLLSEEIYWNKEDDRNCVDDVANKSYSIYCALRIASLEIEDKYNHRNAALQKLRHKIDEQYPNVQWNHRLMDYNNIEETTYEDITNMLEAIEEEFVLETNNRKP